VSFRASGAQRGAELSAQRASHGYWPPFSLAFSRSVCFRTAPYKFWNFQDVSGQTFSRSGRFRIDFQSFQSNFTPELPLNSFSRFSRVTFQSLSGFRFQPFRTNFQPLEIIFQPIRMAPYKFQDVSVWSIFQDETEWR
jgi:hypothetical protein